MKRSHLSHFIWAIVCLGLMALGAYLNSDSADESHLATTQESDSTSSKVRISSTQNQTPSKRPIRTSSRRSDSTNPSSTRTTSQPSGRANSPASIKNPSFSKSRSFSENSPTRLLANHASSPGNNSGSSNTEEGPDSSTVNEATLNPEEINDLVLEAIKEPNPINRRLAFDKLLSSLDETTALPMRSALAKHKADSEHWRLFDYAWSAGDPSAVTTNLPNTAEQHRKGFISNSLPGWAFADPVAAAEFVNDYEPGAVQDQFYNRLVEGLADKDIGMATGFITDMAKDNHPQTPQYTRTVAQELYETGGVSAVQTWASTLPEGTVQNSANSFIRQKSTKTEK